MRKPIVGFVIIVYSFIFALVQLHAQTVPRATIKGNVVDDSTGASLALVNVFIANTMLGTSTDERGSFVLNNVPFGTYKLIISLAGYAPKTLTISLSHAIPKTTEIRLKPVAIELAEVNVVARDPSEWRFNLKRFTTLFLGVTPNADHSKILNPEYLDFEYGKSGQFIARARKPIQIENRALGYRIEYLMEAFTLQGKVLIMKGDARFSEILPINDEQKKILERKRSDTYNGSLRHFLISLFHERLKEDGFLVYLVSSLERRGIRRQVREEDIITAGNVPYEKTLHFKDYLEVVYTRKEPERGYNLLRRSGEPYQISWLTINYDNIILNAEGMTTETFPFETKGYWAWLRMADALPLEFQPEGSQRANVILR